MSVLRQQFELHIVVGPQECLRVGDTAARIGWASVLVLEELPYEFRLMTNKKNGGARSETRQLLEKAPANVREDRSGDANKDRENPR